MRRFFPWVVCFALTSSAAPLAAAEEEAGPCAHFGSVTLKAVRAGDSVEVVVRNVAPPGAGPAGAPVRIRYVLVSSGRGTRAFVPPNLVSAGRAFQARAAAPTKQVLVQAVIEDGPLTYRLACEVPPEKVESAGAALSQHRRL